MNLLSKMPLALAVVMASTVHANEQVNEADVETVLVTATRTEETLASLPYTVQIIDQEEFARQMAPGLDLGSILGQLVPGLGVGDNSVSGFYQSYRGRQVLVLIDGVAQRSSRSISRQLTSISPNNIERVEVISGATAIYGAGATGGVINIITKRAGENGLAFSTEAGFTISTEDTSSDARSYSLAQTIAGKQDALDFLVGLSLEQRGHAIDSNGDQIATDPNQVARDNTDTLDLLLNAGYKLSDTRSVRVSAEYFDEQMDTDYAADFGTPTAATFGLPNGLLGAGGLYEPQPIPGLNLDQQPSSERKTFTLDFSERDFFGQSLVTQLSYRKNDFHFYPYPGTPLYMQTAWAPVLEATNTALAESVAQVLAGEITQEEAAVLVQNSALGSIAQNSRAAASLAQSRIETEILDTKLALSSDFTLGNRDLGLTYGLDYIKDEGSQTSIEYDYQTWLSSGLTQYEKTGGVYNAGPVVETDNRALFLQSDYDLTNKLNIRVGLRRQWVEADVEDYVSGDDVMNANYYREAAQDENLGMLATTLGMTPESILSLVANNVPGQAGNFVTYSDTVATREGGTAKFSATLLNAGATYSISDAQQIYVNYGEGFTLPDLGRYLRSINVLTDGGNQGPILESTNVDAIKTDSWDLGWRGQFNRFDAQASAFYNESDKNINFDRISGVVTLQDQEERIWGLEGLINVNLSESFVAGATYAYTNGETKDEERGWIPLGVERVAPQKITAYLGYQQSDSFDARLQVLNTSDYDKANKENDASQFVSYEGYTTIDFISNIALPVGSLNVAVRNLANEEYKYLYNQVRGYPALGVSADLPAQGRTLSLAHRIEY